MSTAPDPRMPDMPTDAERSRGRYVHVRDGGPAGIDERFVLGDVGGGAVRIRSTRVSASPVGRLEADVRLAPGARGVVLRWTGSGAGVVRDATVECTQVDGLLEVRRVVEGTAYDVLRLDGPLVAPGLVLGGLLAVGPAHVVAIGDARDAAAFVPLPVQVEVEDAGDEVVMVGGSDVVGDVVRWRITGGVTAEGVDVVEGGLLLRRTTGSLVATLTETEGPWPRPSAWPV